MQLSDTQLVIINAAIQRSDWHVLPLPTTLKGGAANKVIESLMAKNLIEEIDAMRDDPVWRETGDGHGATLVLTEHAFAALGIAPADTPEPVAPHSATAGHTRANAIPASHDASATVGAVARKTRDGTKQSVLIDMLRKPDGATIDEIMIATGWQSHTVRGAIAGALKKKLGLAVTSDKIDDRGRVYRIV